MTNFKYIGFQGLAAAYSRMPSSIGVQLDLLQFGLANRRGFALFSLLARTGKSWSLNIMVLGLWLSSSLVQPEWQDGKEMPIAKRVWRWGFNCFQKIEGGGLDAY